ncbi:MAG: tetratricopeptide repeat protein [Chloroherpetonaceae bacterium]
MFDNQTTLLSEAESLCDKAKLLCIKEPQKALAMLKEVEAMLNEHQFEREPYNKVLSRCLAFQSVVYQRLSEFENAKQIACRTLSVASEINDYKAIADAYRVLGSVSFFKGEFEISLEMYEKGLEYSKRSNDKRSTASLFNNIGSVYHHLAKYERAMSYYNQSLELYLQLDDKRGEANVYVNTGNLHYSLGNYANALDYQLKALKTYEAIGDEQGQSTAYSGIGLIYESLGEYQKSIENYQRCLKYEEHTGNRWGYALTLNNMGNVYEAMNDYDNALRAYQESLSIKRQILDRQGVAHTLNNIAELYIKQARYADALTAVNESLEMIENLGDRNAQALCLMTKAKLFAEKNFEQYNLDEAIKCLEQAIEIANEINAKGVLVEAYDKISYLFEQKGDIVSALRYCRLFHKLHEEVKNEESQKRIQNLSMAFEAEKAKKESELRRLEAEKYRLENVELVKANQFKTELLAIAAHDLKNPLQSIMGFAHLIKEENIPSNVKPFVDMIHKGAERMLTLINNLLEDAKFAETATFELKIQTLNLTTLVKSLIEETFEVLAKKKSQTILFESAQDCFVQGDADMLKQVFENLISNAIKYSPRQKLITVSIGCTTINNPSKREVVRVSVKDEGQGLSKDDMEKLFERFQRLSAKPTGGESSTGLGLSIVKKLVELHGGKIWAESEGKDKGATFIVELPVQAMQ